MTPDIVSADRAKRALEAASNAAASSGASARLDVDGFVAALRKDFSAATTEVAKEAVRGDRRAFETVQSIVGYLEDQADLVASTGLFNKRHKIESTGFNPKGREVKIGFNAGLPAVLLLASIKAMRDGVSTVENDELCQRVGALMEKVNVKPEVSLKALDDVFRLSADKDYIVGAAKALVSVGMTLDHAEGLYDSRGERRKAGPASKALDVLSNVIMMSFYRDGPHDLDLQRRLAPVTAQVVGSAAYAAEFIDPTPIMKGASEDAIAKAKQMAAVIGVADFPFTLTNMLVHHGMPQGEGLAEKFPADAIAALSMGGHNGPTPVPGFPRRHHDLDFAWPDDIERVRNFPFRSGQTPGSIIEALAKAMTDAPLDSNGEFTDKGLRRISMLMESRSRSGEVGVLRLFEPVVKVMAQRGQPLLYDARSDSPEVVKYLIDQGHGSMKLHEKHAWRQSPVQSLFNSIVRERDLTNDMARSLKVLIAAGADPNMPLKAPVRRQDLPKFIAADDQRCQPGSADVHQLQFTLADRLRAIKPLVGSPLNQVKTLVEASQAREIAAADDRSHQMRQSRSIGAGHAF